MLTNSELTSDKNVMEHAYNIQHEIEHHKSVLAGLEVEYVQLINYMKKHGIERQGRLVLCIKRVERRKVDPELFAKTFPDANDIIVQNTAIALGIRRDDLISRKIMDAITVKEAEELVGKIPLEKAVVRSVTETPVIMMDEVK